MVVEYFVNTEEPNVVCRLVLRNHVTDNDFRNVDLLLLKQRLQEKGCHLSERCVRDLVCRLVLRRSYDAEPKLLEPAPISLDNCLLLLREFDNN
jgi:hypothetical protein